MRALVLLSGGLDSAANLAFAKSLGWNVGSLTLDYGQRSAVNEIKSAAQIPEYYDVRHEVIVIDIYRNLNAGALLGGAQLPSPDLENRTEVENGGNQVWVPNRNLVFVSVAAAIAEAREIGTVLVGWNKEEAETFPDNSGGFLKAVNGALTFSTKAKVQVDALTINMTKAEIVRGLGSLPTKFPVDMLWSCYSSGTKQCGACESCKRFKRAFKYS